MCRVRVVGAWLRVRFFLCTFVAKKTVMETSLQQPIPEEGARGKRTSWLGYALKYVVPLVITVGLCWLLLHDVNVKEMMHIISTECNFWWIVAALAVSILSHVVRAARWQLQLNALDVRPGLWTLTLSIFGTYAVNLVFPRLGEVWRTGWIAKRQDASFTKVFGSMVADRLTDTLTVASLVVLTFCLAAKQMLTYLGLQQADDGETPLIASPWLWGGVALIILVGIIIVRQTRHTAVMQRTKKMLTGLWQGFAVVLHMPHRGRFLLLTVALYGCYFMQLYLAFFAFPQTALVVERHGIIAVLVCFVLSSLAMAVPSNGGLGPWQWSVVFGLSLYSAGQPLLTQDYAAAFANLVMGMQTLLLIVLGIFTFICIALQRKSTVPANTPSPVTEK